MARSAGNPARRSTRRWLVLAAAGIAVSAGVVFVFRSDLRSSANGIGHAAATASPVRWSFTVVNTYPHDPEAFTQGLLFRDGFLYESTGLHGRSSVRKVRLETGEVVHQRPVDRAHFGEGLVDWGDRLIQLTWQSNLGFIYALDSFEPLGTFMYPGEGWGLARNATHLIMSDGTSTLRLLDPTTLNETRRIAVSERGLPVSNINELEMVGSELLANIWQTDEVVVIAPDTGQVAARIDFGPLRARLTGDGPVDVLNGLAWDQAGRRLFVTGKLWPQLFEVRLHQ